MTTFPRRLGLGLGRTLRKSPILYLLAIGFAIRLTLAPFTSWTVDVYPFYRAAVDMSGGLDPYATYFYTYPPLFAYLLFFPKLLLGLIANPQTFAVFVNPVALTAEVSEMILPTVTAPTFNLVLKLPVIVADLGIALILLTWISNTFGERRGRTGFLLWWLNPLVIWVTALQGQFDAIPAFFALAAAFLLTRRMYWFSGLALGFAILFKVYPLFLLLPLLLLAVARERGQPAERGPSWGPSARAGLAFLLGNGIVLAAFALPLLSTPFLEATFFRRSQFFIVGGFHPLFILMLDVWERTGFGQFVLASLPEFPYTFTLLLIVGFLVPAVVFFRLRRRLGPMEGRVEAAIAFLAVFSLVALFTVLPLVQPHYLLWILPFLILASAVWQRLRVTIAIISLAGLAFLLSLQGVAVFFYPLAVFTPLLGIEEIHAQVVAYWDLPGLVSSQLRLDLLALASGVGYVLLFYAAYRVTRDFLSSQGSHPAPAPALANPDPQPRIARRLRLTVAALAAVLVVSGGLVLVQDVPRAAVIEGVVADPALGTVAVDLQGHSLFSTTYRVTALTLGSIPQDLPLFLYYDARYAISNLSGPPSIFGLIDHLRGEFARARVSWDVQIVDATQLIAVLRGPPVILVMTTTAWPTTVLPAQPTLVRGWLEGGGILIWSGALLGAYAGTTEDEVLDLREGEPTGPWGPSVILGFNPVREGGPNRTSQSSIWGTSLAVRYPLATWGARASEVEARGGLVLGGLTSGPDPKASLSLLPVGNGTVALFGDAIGPVFTYSAEDVVAHDIARLLLTGLLFNPREGQASLLGSERVELAAGQRGRVALPVVMTGEARRLLVLVFSELDHDPLLRALTVPP